MGYTDVHRRYLNSIGRNTVPLVALAIGTLIHYFLSMYLVIQCRMGITGTGIAGVVLWSLILVL